MLKAPEPDHDNHYRIHQSALVYGLNAYILDGMIYLSFQCGAQRVVYTTGERKFVRFENNFYELHSSEIMRSLIEIVLKKRRSSICILGNEVENIEQVTPHSFFYMKFFDGRDDIRHSYREQLDRMLAKQMRKSRSI